MDRSPNSTVERTNTALRAVSPLTFIGVLRLKLTLVIREL